MSIAKILAIGCGLLASAAASEIQASVAPLLFQGGGTSENESSNSVDAFPGCAGEGWDSPWKIISQKGRGTTFELKVVDSPPSDSAKGKSLEVTFETGNSVVAEHVGVSRLLDMNGSADGIDPTQPYSIRFVFRIDEASPDFIESNDLFAFSGTVPDGRGEATMGGEVWAVFLRQKAGWGTRSDPANPAVTKAGANIPVPFGERPVGVSPGSAWEVEVSIDPPNKTFQVNVVGGGQSFTSPPVVSELLGPDHGSPALLRFMASRKGEGKSTRWSLGDITVTQ